MTEDQITQDQSLRQHLLELLTGESAHVNFDRATEGIDFHMVGLRPEGIPYSIWELVEHMRIAQWDIVQFCINPRHVSPDFPEGYWPKQPRPRTPEAWRKSLEAFRSDLQAMQELVQDPSIDLFTPIPHGQGQTYLREALLVSDHNTYHLGQIVAIRRRLDIWPHTSRQL